MTQKPLYILVHPDDNVAIVVNSGGLPPGTEFPSGLVLTDFVPQGHKVALTDLASGQAIVRYGQVIGRAACPIARGAWVEESAVTLPQAPPLDSLPLSNAVPAAQPPLEGHSFEGYRNPDGSVGTKNVLGISISVQCVAGVMDHAVDRIKRELLPRYPNVDDVVALNHTYGCGVAINAPGAVVPIRTLQAAAWRSTRRGRSCRSAPCRISPATPIWAGR